MKLLKHKKLNHLEQMKKHLQQCGVNIQRFKGLSQQMNQMTTILNRLGMSRDEAYKGQQIS